MIKLDKEILKRTEQELKQRTTYKDLTVHGYKIKDLPVVKDDYSPAYLVSGEVYKQIEREIRKQQEKEAINVFSKWMAKVAHKNTSDYLNVVILNHGILYATDTLLVSNKKQTKKKIKRFLENPKTINGDKFSTETLLKSFVMQFDDKCYYFDVETKRIVSITDYDNLPQLKEVRL
ncbi:hypothetical protein R4Y45_06150 [Holzapfeliella sp. He02]|uniref:Phage protein n=1 Tax=Holzapfeliella saturejae TaxID=3082953 RepID=A0ABU8SJF1_9LACO